MAAPGPMVCAGYGRCDHHSLSSPSPGRAPSKERNCGHISKRLYRVLHLRLHTADTRACRQLLKMEDPPLRPNTVLPDDVGHHLRHRQRVRH